MTRPEAFSNRRELYITEHQTDFDRWEAEFHTVPPDEEVSKFDDLILEEARKAETLDFADVAEHAESAEDFRQWAGELDIDVGTIAFEEAAVAAEPEPGAFPGHAETLAQYDTQLMWRAAVAGCRLDSTRAAIATDEDAQEWLELKMAVAATKAIGMADYAGKVTAVIEIEKASWEFMQRMGTAWGGE